MTDYRNYRFSKKEWLENGLFFLMLAGGMAYLFYRSWIAFVCLLPFGGYFFRIRRQSLCLQRQRRLESQFLSGIRAVSTALTAGYSVEHGFTDACRELEQIYEPGEMILEEFHYIAGQLGMNRNLEDLLQELADRSGAEEIGNFSEIFSAAKRTGGNLLSIIHNTAWNIGQKEETRREIETCLSAKRLEQNIMSLVPAMILFYVQLVSPGFLDGMYHNPAGIAVMTICLLVYGAAWLWGRKIVDIDV